MMPWPVLDKPVDQTSIAATVGAVIVAVAMAVNFYNWIVSAIYGEKAPDNPWGSNSLEWAACPSPPGPGNFPTPPEVTEDWHPHAYEPQKA